MKLQTLKYACISGQNEGWTLDMSNKKFVLCDALHYKVLDLAQRMRSKEMMLGVTENVSN